MRQIIDTFRKWRHLSGYSNRKIIKPHSKLLSIVEYKVNIANFPVLNNKKILFFSDLHFGSQKINIEDCKNIIKNISPDWIVFGGDLITYACFQDEAFSFLNEIFSEHKNIPKIAVFGNWDRRRNKWYPDSKWHKAFNEVGFNLLVNENIEYPELNFYGMDEPRLGNPQQKNQCLSEKKFNCILSHSVDPVIDTFNEVPSNYKRLYLCGH
jgi:predicted MPP superfamily phosphohydrolase